MVIILLSPFICLTCCVFVCFVAAPKKKKRPKSRDGRRPLEDRLNASQTGLRPPSGSGWPSSLEGSQSSLGGGETNSQISINGSGNFRAHIETNHKIQASTIKFGDFLGQGSFGVVTRCKWQGQEVAVKAIDRKGIVDEDEREALMKEFLHEFHTSFNLRSPRIVQIFGYFLSSDDSLCIVMEFAGGGSIRSRLEKFESLDQDCPLILQLRWASDVALGMEYLHNLGIMHRDLKSPNVLLDSNDRGKVADFGLAKAEEAAQKVTGSFNTVMAEVAQMGSGNGSTMGTVNGSPPWMPPEAINGQRSMLSDVYAFGIMIWELRTSKMPWLGEGPVGVLYKVGVLKMRPQPMPADGDEHPLHDLMVRSWDHDEEVRPQFEEAARIAEGIRLALESIGAVSKCLMSKLPDPDLSASMAGMIDRQVLGEPEQKAHISDEAATMPKWKGPVNIEMSMTAGNMRRSV